MGLRFCALTGEGAAILCRRVFPHPSRRGGACPSRHSVAGGPSFHTVGVGHWPARFLFSGQFRSTHPRPCTLCHGWSEPGAAVKWHRPKFCTAPGPSGPGEIIPGTIFCAPEILRKGIGVSPVNGGLGENELEPEGTCFRRRCESPPAILWFLSHRRERNSPPGRRNSPPQRSGSAGRLDAARRRGAYAPKGKRSRPLTPDPAVPGPPGPAWTVPHFCSACL